MGLAEDYEWQAGACAALGSPFYEALLRRIADELRAGGALADVLGPTVRPTADLHALRLLGGVHRLVLDGDMPSLAAHYPSTGGDGDAVACWPPLRDLLGEPPPSVIDSLDRAPQTNEVARAGPLGSGVAVVAADSGLPIRLLEIGSSAGLNLRLENYWFEAGSGHFGDRDSPIRFVDVWDGGTPPLSETIRIVERRGCDLAPIDPASEEGRLRLLSYVWPDQAERFDRLRTALDLADRIDAPVEQASADEWLGQQLGIAHDGATVVQQSICWFYMPTEVQDRIVGTLREAGAVATDSSPLAWLRLELAGMEGAAELRLMTWPGGDDRVLAETSPHPTRIRWLT